MVFVVLGLVAAICYGILYLLGPWLEARNLGKFDPRLNTAPPDISNQAQAPLSNTTFDHYGFMFQLPNREIGRTHVGELAATMSLPNQGLLILHNTQDFNAVYMPQIIKRDKRIERLLGPELVQSNLTLMQVALPATPGQVKWWRFRSAENQRQEVLLTIKLLTLAECAPPPHLTAPAYTIAFGAFRGIQCGNPDIAPYDAHIDVFDKDDRHFSLEITGPEGHGQVLTQEELNAMVASIRPSPKQ